MGSFRGRCHDMGTRCVIAPSGSDGGPAPGTSQEHKGQAHLDSRAFEGKLSLDSTHQHPGAARATEKRQGVSVDLYHLLLHKIKSHLLHIHTFYKSDLKKKLWGHISIVLRFFFQ